MARYDKYDPISGGFRAALETALTPNGAGEVGPLGVSLNTSGRCIVGTAGASGLVGVMVKNAPLQSLGRRATTLKGVPNPDAWIGQKANDVVDIMTSGEIVGVTGFNPGDSVYVHANGSVDNVPTAGTRVGWIAGSGNKLRMVIRVAA